MSTGQPIGGNGTDVVINPSPTDNARFQDEGGGTVSEMMAHQVQFFYDPTTMQARSIFNGKPYLNISNVYRALDESNDILHVDFSDKLAKCYGQHLGTLTDPATGVDLTNVSVAGVMALMKAAYDEEFNLRAFVIASQIAAAEAAARDAAESVVTVTQLPDPPAAS
jgi:hypothetical protein